MEKKTKRGVGNDSRESSLLKLRSPSLNMTEEKQKAYEDSVNELRIGVQKFGVHLEKQRYHAFLEMCKKTNMKPSDPELSKNYRNFVLPDSMRPRPNERTDTPNWGDDPFPEARKLVELTLDYINDDSDDNLEFVGGLHISAFVDEGVCCHLKFVTKVKVDNKNNIGPYLTFAELRRLPEQFEYEVLVCQNLGTAASLPYTKLLGCRACDKAPDCDVLTHGHRSKFNVGFTPQFR